MFKPKIDRISYGGCLIDQRERDAINNVIDKSNGRMWTLGEESVQFEKELATAAGVNHAVVVNSGSSALLAAITALHLPAGSKVIIPALNFPTAYASIVQNFCVPVVVDCSLENFNLSLDAVKKSIIEHPDVVAVVAVHIAGNVVDMVKLREIVGDRIIIGDNCDGFGGTLHNKMIDTYADISCISMHAAHIISMGEGGAVLTNNEEYARRAKKIREWGRASGSDQLTTHEGLPEDYRERYVYEEVGYNFKPLELQCAMGRVQLTKLDEFKARRHHNYHALRRQLEDIEIFTMVEAVDKSFNCWFGFPFLTKDRPKVMDHFEKHNIETRTVFSGNILRHPAYKNITHIVAGSLENSDYVMKNGMFLSNHPVVTDEMIQYMGEVARDL